MNKAKNFSLFLVLVMLFSSTHAAYSADSYHYALTDMTWAEFYSGEIGDDFDESEYDAVSTATQRFTGRLNQLVSHTTESGGTIYSGVKAVQVRMTQDVYNILSSDARYSSWDIAEFDEYKTVDATGSFGAMVSETQKVSGVTTELASGPSTHHTQYALEFSGLDLASLGLKLGEGSGRTSTFDYFLGGLLETSDGKKYGLKHLDNLWVNAGEIGFCVEAYTDNGNKGYLHTADLTGKTITKITFMLKNQADPYIECSVYVRQKTTATVAPVYEDGLNAVEAGSPVEFTFTNTPSDSKYDSVVSISYDDPNGHHGWSTLSPENYTYSDNKLTLSGEIASKTHQYNIVFGDSNGKYINIGTSFMIFSTEATSAIISPDNNLGSLNFLLTPEGVSDTIDNYMTSANFVNASDYTDPAKNFSIEYTGGERQLADSGFSFDITLNDVPEGKTGVVGFGKIFYLTPENCGEMYPFIYAQISALESYPSGFKGIFGSQFRGLGMKIYSVQDDGSVLDVTDYVGAGAMISDDANIMIYYGVMLADRDITQDDEGKTHPFSPEGETLLSDGKADGHLRAAWYFEILSANADVVDEPDNKAGISFEAMREGFILSADEEAESQKLQWVIGDMSLGGESEFITNRNNQLPGNSGFSFTVSVDMSKIDSGCTPMLGFSRLFAFTADNMGEDFTAFKSKVESLQNESESGIITDYKVLTDYGLKVMAVYYGSENASTVMASASQTETDITDKIQFGMFASGDSVYFNHGAIIVDREITDNEGGKFNMVFEQSPLISDGSADGKITASWFITKSDSPQEQEGSDDESDNENDENENFLRRSSSSCNSLNIIAPALMLGVLLIAKYKK